tara:strand:- start:51 stop:407 length:357 start_codon:yes stop_codon:yes gene_type:complete
MTKHAILPIVVSLLALAFVDPFMYWMPSHSTWFLLGALFLTTVIYGFFIMTERVSDEREVSIRAFSDRVSSLVGMALLVIVIACQAFKGGVVSTEVAVILVTMIISKSAAQWWANHKM